MQSIDDELLEEIQRAARVPHCRRLGSKDLWLCADTPIGASCPTSSAGLYGVG